VGGDALDLVRATLGLRMGEAMAWSRRWLGIEDGAVALPVRPALAVSGRPRSSNYWRSPWRSGCPITGTLAASYLRERGLAFEGLDGCTLRFRPQHPRRNDVGELEHHPALLVLLSDTRTGNATGLINIYLTPDGSDRLRDAKGKSSWGRAAGSAVMLS